MSADSRPTQHGYSTYKDSGIAWLGEIPDHWKCSRVKQLAGNHIGIVQTGPFGAQLHASDYTDEGVPLVLIRNVNSLRIDDNGIPRISSEKAESLSMYRLLEGDIVFSRVGSIGRLALVTERESGWLISGQMLRLRIQAREMLNAYAVYFLSASSVTEYVSLVSVGSTRDSLNTEIIRNIPILLPPLPEQRAIARFLDHKTAQIDALIAKKEALLARLADKRTALISHAVTKGLDPDAPMKDSGVEWLGEIPEHWGVKRLRFLMRESLANGIFKKKESWGSGTRIVNVFDVYTRDDVVDENSLDRLECTDEEAKKYSAEHGDFFFVRSSLKLEGVGKSASVLNPSEPMVFECHLVRGRPDQEQIDPRFLNLYLNCHQARLELVSRANQVTMTTIDQGKFNDIWVPTPDLSEQRSIVAQLEASLEELDYIERNIQAAITRLKDYRTALITHAVTGKIDVRAVPVPEYSMRNETDIEKDAEGDRIINTR